LVNQLGQVVGLVTSKLNDLGALQMTGEVPQNVNYALRSSILQAFLETIPELNQTSENSPMPSTRPVAEVIQAVVDATVPVLIELVAKRPTP
jgi:hypothetical protein